MPEGDTIYRSAKRMDPVLSGRSIIAATSNDRYLRSPMPTDCQVTSVEARGKHLLIHLSGAKVLHSHMGMTGSWHLYRPGDAWRKPARSAAVSLVVQGENDQSPYAEAVCFSPKSIELRSEADIQRHPFLRRLGPDLMMGAATPSERTSGVAEAVLPRLRYHDRTPLGEALLNQTILAGIGNVYKSEMLFLCRLNPFAPVVAFHDETLIGLVDLSQKHMAKNIIGHPRKTRYAGDPGRVWVYARHAQPCYKCGGLIAMRRQGDLGRSTYYCPNCQGVSDFVTK